MKESKKIAKTINEYLNKKEIKKQIYTGNEREIKEKLKSVLMYYTMTRDTDTDLDIEDIKRKG